MPYIAAEARSYEKQSIGNGQCVAFVRAASKAPHTSAWKQGKLVKTTNTIFPGTAIATFDPNGKYGSREDGTSHAAIFIRKSVTGQLCGGDTVTSCLSIQELRLDSHCLVKESKSIAIRYKE